MTPSHTSEPPVKSGLSMPRARASRFAWVTVLFRLKSRKARLLANNTNHSSSSFRRIGLMAGLAVCAMRFISDTASGVSLSSVLSMLASAVACVAL